MKMKSLIALAVLASSSAFAETKLSDCVIQEVIPGKDMTGAFLKFEHSGKPVQIESASIPSITSDVELHAMEMKDGVMSMIPLQNKELKEGERVFKKGGDHVMLMKIAADKFPKAGEKHTITVNFDDKTSASCEAEVKTVKEVIEAAKAKGDWKDEYEHGHSHEGKGHEAKGHEDKGHQHDCKKDDHKHNKQACDDHHGHKHDKKEAHGHDKKGDDQHKHDKKVEEAKK